MQNRYRKRIIAITVLLLIGLIGMAVLQIYNNRHFRLTKSVPNITGTVSTSTNGFRLYFNKDLDAKTVYSKGLSDSTHLVSQIQADKRSIFIFISPLSQSRAYAFTLSNIKASNGETIPVIKFNFTAKFIPFKKLSKDQQALINQITQQYKKDYPLLVHLPYSTLDFRIEASLYSENNESAKPGKPAVQASLLLTNADVKINAQAAADRYKQEVIDYIKSLGFNPDDYNIQYIVVSPTT